MGEGTKAVSVDVRGKAWQRHGEQAWRTLIERQRASGMSIQTFCEREGVSRSSFGRWRSLLAKRATGAQRLEECTVGEHAAVAAPRSGFVDAGMLRMGGVSEPVEVRLELGGGIVVTIRRG